MTNHKDVECPYCKSMQTHIWLKMFNKKMIVTAEVFQCMNCLKIHQ